MARAYDTSQQFRKGTLLHIQYLYDEIVVSQKRLDKAEKEVAVIKERIKKLKKELGLRRLAHPNQESGSVDS